MKHYGDIDGIGLDGAGGVNQLLNWGILPASLTQTEIDNLTVTPTGLAVFNVTDNKWVRWNGTAWVPFAEGEDVSYLNDLLDVTTGLPLTPTNADDGRLLYYDIDTGQWISDDIANISNVVKDCKTSVATGTIAKGVPVYLAGYDNDLLVVEPCDASDPNKMPCIGVTAEVLDDTNAKKIVSFGKIQGVDTSAWADGTQLWVAPGGGFTTTRPTGGTTQIQRVVRVLKGLDATGGQIKVFNTSRVAGLPNLGTGNIWVGDANGHPVETPIPGGGGGNNWIPMFSGGLFATNQIFYSNWEESTAVQANVEVNFPASTLKAFKINCNTNNANNPTVIDVVRGASVLISLIIPGNTTGVYTATGSVPIAEDDLLCIRVTIPAGGPSIGLRGGLLNIEV